MIVCPKDKIMMTSSFLAAAGHYADDETCRKCPYFALCKGLSEKLKQAEQRDMERGEQNVGDV